MEDSTMNAEKRLRIAFDEYFDAIYRFCYFKVSDKALASDLAQEAFIRLWKQFLENVEIKNIKAFLFTVARNLTIDHYRKKNILSLDSLVESGYEPVFNVDYSSNIDFKIAFESALKQLRKLDEKYQDAIHLRYVEDLLPSEIAEILDESENVISVRIHRGLKQLRDLLGHK